MVELRKHQRKPVERTVRLLRQGHRRLLGRAPTGSGKTIMALEIYNRWHRRGDRLLVLVHKRKILRQWIDRVLDLYPHLGPVAEIGNGRFSNGVVMVAMVQTLVNRLEDLDQVDFIIADEAHRSVANQYRKCVNRTMVRFGHARLLGVTATTTRADEQSLGIVYDKVAFDIPVYKLIRQGVLARPVIKRYDLKDISFLDVPFLYDDAGRLIDYKADVAGQLMDTQYARRMAVAAWHKHHVRGTKAIVFCSSIAQARNYALEFELEGYTAKCVTGNTSQEMRDMAEQYANVIVNVDVYTEGADIEGVGTVVMASPTRSRSRYIQRAGRGLRPDTDKCIIIDLCPTEASGLVDAKAALSKPPSRFEKWLLRSVQPRMEAWLRDFYRLEDR